MENILEKLLCAEGDELLKTRGHRQVYELSLQEFSAVVRSIVHRSVTAKELRVYTRTEAAERCKMSTGTFRRALDKIGFKPSRIDRKLFFTENDLIEILNKLKKPAKVD
jgi:hypothetical protein